MSQTLHCEHTRTVVDSRSISRVFMNCENHRKKKKKKRDKNASLKCRRMSAGDRTEDLSERKGEKKFFRHY